jgi:cell division protein FtsQ
MAVGTAPPAAVSVVVDPRFEARRAAVEREQRRHRRDRLVGLAGGLLTLLVIYGLSRSPLLTVNQVQVVGGDMTGVAGIKAAAGIHSGDHMADIDLAAARRRLEALPWVRSARVGRSWPRTVRIVVAERGPIARIADEDGHRWWMADATGRLLDAVANPPDGLVQVDGAVSGGRPGVQLAPRATAALRLIAHFPAEVAQRAIGVRFAGADEMQLVLQPDPANAGDSGGGSGTASGSGPSACQKIDVPAPLALAELGTGESMEEKLLALAAVLTQVDNRQLATVDVRVPDKPVVTRRTSCQ